MLLVGCGSNGDGLTTITTPEQASAAGTAIAASLSSNLAIGDARAPAFQSPAPAFGFGLDPVPRMQAIQRQGATLAAKAKTISAPGIKSWEMTCTRGGSGNYTEIFDPVTGDYSYSETADHCSNGIDSDHWERHGTYSDSLVHGADGVATYTRRRGNGDGTADSAIDNSYTYTGPGYTESYIYDEESTQTFYDVKFDSEDFNNKAYAGTSKGQSISIDGTETRITTENSTYSGKQSWDATAQIYTNAYSFTDHRNFSFAVAGSSPPKAILLKTGKEFPGSTKVTRHISGTRKEYRADGYTLDSPHGTISLSLSPAPGSGYDCRNANGRYSIETITPLKTEEGGDWIAPELPSNASPAPFLVRAFSNRFTAGELRVNGNTTLLFTPDNVTITLTGASQPVFDGPIDMLLEQESDTCPLFSSLDARSRK